MSAARFIVETDVPIPPGGRERGASKYPFASMKIGDSFPVQDDEWIKRRVATSVSRWNRDNPSTKFIMRKTDNGARVWRIA